MKIRGDFYFVLLFISEYHQSLVILFFASVPHALAGDEVEMRASVVGSKDFSGIRSRCKETAFAYDKGDDGSFVIFDGDFVARQQFF